MVIRHIALAIEIISKAIELRPSTLSSRTPPTPPSYVCAYFNWSCDITTPDSAHLFVGFRKCHASLVSDLVSPRVVPEGL